VFIYLSMSIRQSHENVMPFRRFGWTSKRFRLINCQAIETNETKADLARFASG